MFADMMTGVGEIADADRARLWEQSGEDEERFLALLTEAGYGQSRLAGQVNLLVHVTRRAFHDLRHLRWTWNDVTAATGVSFETYRKLRILVRNMQNRTKWAIADGLGWTQDSVDRMLAMGEPVVDPEWRPFTDRRTGSAPDQRRAVFTHLGLSGDDLDDVLRRYDAHDPPTRRLAAAIARALNEDIDGAFRALLLQTARNKILRGLAEERESAEDLVAALDQLRHA